jgi:hypothetical protein
MKKKYWRKTNPLLLAQFLRFHLVHPLKQGSSGKEGYKQKGQQEKEEIYSNKDLKPTYHHLLQQDNRKA